MWAPSAFLLLGKCAYSNISPASPSIFHAIYLNSRSLCSLSHSFFFLSNALCIFLKFCIILFFLLLIFPFYSSPLTPTPSPTMLSLSHLIPSHLQSWQEAMLQEHWGLKSVCVGCWLPLWQYFLLLSLTFIWTQLAFSPVYKMCKQSPFNVWPHTCINIKTCTLQYTKVFYWHWWFHKEPFHWTKGSFCFKEEK